MTNEINTIVTDDYIWKTTEDGREVYYSKRTDMTATGYKSLSRMLDCDVTTIRNTVKSLIKRGELLEEISAELPTAGGLQGVNIVLESDLNTVLTAISENKRIKSQTRKNAEKIQSKFVQAGFRLMTLLEVAPEKVAIEAINNIEDSEALKEVEHATELHKNYLDSFHGLGEAIVGAHALFGPIHGHNNRLVSIPNGKRKEMTTHQKEDMIMLQLMEKRRLEHKKSEYKDSWDATNDAKATGTKTRKQIDDLKK